MRIEKISDNQIKFVLTNDDLRQREIKLTELAQGTEKAQAFFRDIMTEAMLDCGFDATNTPLMIEAMPVAADSVMIIVSKVEGDGNITNVISLTPKSFDERKFKQGDLKILENRIDVSEKAKIDDEDTQIYIYSFKTLNQVIDLASRLGSMVDENNRLYKYEEKYFLIIQKPLSFTEDIESVSSEYGQKHISTIVSKYHLEEHAEIIIKKNALNILANI